MENNESNIKPQSTGGLKLMTVFIVVLALHVLVIGGVTIYHLMSGGGADSNLADNKATKDAKVAADGSVVMDTQLPDASQSDKTTAAESTPPAPAIEQTTPAQTATSPAPTTAAAVQEASTPTGPVVTPPQPPVAETTMATEPTTAPPMEPEVPVNSAVSGTYVVKMNDTLAKIAHRHHTTVAKLQATNELNGELLHVGQRLVIPGKSDVVAVPATYTTGTTILSGTPVPTPDETPAAPAPAPASASASHRTYTVVKGDTLTRIAHRFKTTTKALMEVNNITDPTKLSIGRKLTIPSHGTQTTTTTPVPTPAAAQPVQAKSTSQLANYMQ